ncbi:MAG: DUF1697 domain-containing protein [Thermoanaerobaculia bacterium]
MIALLRGINVGKAKRVAMADLRALVEHLGYSDVRTLLNSGNLVFTAPGITPAVAGARIEEALAKQLGVPSRITVLTSAELSAIIEGNPLLDIANDPSRLLVAVLAKPGDRKILDPLLKEDWSPEALATGSRVAYLWCPEGILASRLPEAVGKVLRDGVTTRNWSTITKLQALVG